MNSNDLLTLAQRMREYNHNPHHINPVSESFHTLIKDSADALSAVAKEGQDPEAWPSHGNAPLAIASALALAVSTAPQPAPAQDVAGWIPVTERLPEVAQEVIVSTEFEGVCAGILDSYGEWFAPCSEYKLTRVTHWMPLPAAPGSDKQAQEVPVES